MLLLLGGYATVQEPRYGGGKRIASYLIGNDGNLKEEMSKLRKEELEREKQDYELALAIAKWWIND